MVVTNEQIKEIDDIIKAAKCTNCGKCNFTDVCVYGYDVDEEVSNETN